MTSKRQRVTRTTEHCTPGVPHGTAPAFMDPPPQRALEGLWRGGGTPSPLQGAQHMPSRCPPDGNGQLQWHL